jgi:NAD(P) transhydrogenase
MLADEDQSCESCVRLVDVGIVPVDPTRLVARGAQCRHAWRGAGRGTPAKPERGNRDDQNDGSDVVMTHWALVRLEIVAGRTYRNSWRPARMLGVRVNSPASQRRGSRVFDQQGASGCRWHAAEGRSDARKGSYRVERALIETLHELADRIDPEAPILELRDERETLLVYRRPMSERFDLVVLGAGPAGEKGAVQAAYFGHRVLVVDKAAEPGGAAVHTGTLPSKTLRETALYLSGFRARDLYGIAVELEDPHAAVPRLIARKDTIARTESQRIRENLDRHGVELVRGRARFVDPHRLEIELVDGSRREVETRFTLIATGSSPRNPPDVPISEPDVYDSDEILALDHLPDRLVVLGAGVIGCEYACMFAALGVKVTLVEARTQFLSFLDHEIGRALERSMRERLGIEIRKGHRWGKIHRDTDGKLRCDLADGSVLVCEKLLFAAGRVGNTDGLGLESVGLSPNDRGALEVDDRFRTKVPSIYAAGDVIGFPALASTSMEQARVAVCHAFDIAYKKNVARIWPYGIYTIPEVSCVGHTEESCQAEGIPYVVGRASHRDNARGMIVGDHEGMTKLVVHAETRALLGVHLIGERASELVHIGQAVLHAGGSVDAFIDMVFNYPTLSEAYKYAAYAALGALAKHAAAR